MKPTKKSGSHRHKPYNRETQTRRQETRESVNAELGRPTTPERNLIDIDISIQKNIIDIASKSIIVSGKPVGLEFLYEFFSTYGTIELVYIGQEPWIGHITYSTIHSVDMAIKGMHGLSYGGKPIRVSRYPMIKHFINEVPTEQENNF